MDTQRIIFSAAFCCAYCQKMYKNAKTHATHIRKYHHNCVANQAPTPFHHCQKCPKMHENKATLNHGISASAADTTVAPTFHCDAPQCTKSFRNRKRLSEHKRRTHCAAPQLICEFCGYATRFRCNLLVHRRTHTGELPFCCECCGKCFAARYQLAEHRHTHEGNRLRRHRTHRCDICGVAFLRPKALHHHGALHLAQKKFVCDMCGKAYAQAAGLSQHRRWHREIKTTTKMCFQVGAKE